MRRPVCYGGQAGLRVGPAVAMRPAADTDTRREASARAANAGDRG